MARVSLSVSLVSLLIIGFVSEIFSASFTINNNCDYTVWPGLLSGAGTSQLPSTGFALQKGESNTIPLPAGWSGRVWGRTLCSEDSTGKFSCVTGDCGSGKVECSGSGAAPPASLAEFTLNGAGGLDFYDVSLVDGYNLPMMITPQGGSGANCTTTGCLAELNSACPSELRVMSSDGSQSVGCKSACLAFGEPQYCCSGTFSTPDTCKPSSYSLFFKNACPRAYSYAYDDGTSTFTCASANYLITFCPTVATSTSKKSSDGNLPEATGVPLTNDTMVITGGNDASGASSTKVVRGQVIAGAASILAAIWQLWQLF